LQAKLPKTALHRAKGQRICSEYWYELKKSFLDSEAVLAAACNVDKQARGLHAHGLGGFMEELLTRLAL